MNKSASIAKLAPALAKAQAEMPVVKMNAQNPFLKNKYADLGAVIETSRPILSKHGLAITQTPVSDGDKIGITTMLIHESGEWLEDTIFITSANNKGLSDAQNAGVVISYLRRYSWSSILGLYADEDNDGNHPKPASSGAVAQSGKSPVKVPMKLDEAKRYKDSNGELYTDKSIEQLQKIANSEAAPEDKKNAARLLIAEKEGK
jgi:hypothetical protein